MNVLVYPIVMIMHMSNPTAPPRHEVTEDFIGGGIGVEFNERFAVEAVLGARSAGCMAPDCGRSAAAHITFTWRGKKR